MDAILQDDALGINNNGNGTIFWIIGIGIAATVIYFFFIKK